MAIDSSFDYDRLLTLDQAKLVGRTRINSLGSYELTLNYNKITSVTKEDCLEWLEANRLSIVDPIFSNKTYEGTWKCVSIAYDENKSIIQQIFKIDSQVGNLGDTADEPDYGLQAGETSRISSGMEIQKAYYWKVVNPTDVQLPTARVGEIWTKTANDNGDGTYDVVVSREIEVNLEGTNTADNYAFTEVTEIDTNDTAKTVPAANIGDEVSVTNTPQENGLFRTTSTTKTAKNQEATNTAENYAFTEVTEIDTNDVAKTVPAANIGDEVSVTNAPLSNGLFRTTETTKTAKNQTGNGERKIGSEAGTGATTSIYVSGFTTANGTIDYTGGNQEYALYYEFISYEPSGSTLDKAVWFDTGTTYADLPVYEDSAGLWEMWSNGTTFYITLATATVGTPPTNRYESSDFYDGYVGQGSYSGKTAMVRSTLDLVEVSVVVEGGAPIHAKWIGVDDPTYSIYKDAPIGGTWKLFSGTTKIAERQFQNLNSDSWKVTWGTTSEELDENLVVQIGRNPPSSTQESVINTNGSEQSFVSDGGAVPDPVAGEEITISNVPLDNGLFKTTVTTTTVAKQRVPALFDSIIYASNGNFDKNAFASGTNATYAEFQKDLNWMRLQKESLTNTVSVNINKYGLYDYTIRSVEI